MQANQLDVPEFTDEQLRAILEQVGREALQAAFAVGRPVLIIRDAHFVELYPDGTERTLGLVRQEPATAPNKP